MITLIKYHETFNPFQRSIVFHIEISLLFCPAKQMTGFYMKHNIGLPGLIHSL